MPKLILPDAAWHSAWLDAHAEWGPGLHEDGFGLLPTDEVRSRTGFTAWVTRLEGDEHCTYRWIVEDGRVVGGTALRHDSHPGVQRMGHLGYGIRPTARRRGFAARAVGLMIAEASALGIPQVIAVCETGNTASRRTVEHHGGVLLPDSPSAEVVRYRLCAAP